MARPGSRMSRRLGRNNRTVQKMLRGGKRKREPKTKGVATPKVDRVKRRGKRIHRQAMAESQRKKISAGLKRYWRNKQRRRTATRRNFVVNSANSIDTGGKRGF